MKPHGLVRCSINPTWINYYFIREIEVDLRHINYGLDHVKVYSEFPRSDFQIGDIQIFFESLSYLAFVPDKVEDWEYFVTEKRFFDKNKIHKIVFCINQTQPHVAGIITLFRLKRSRR